MLRKKERVPSGHHSFNCEQSGMTMIWVKAISLPWIMAEDNLRFEFAYHFCYSRPGNQIVCQFAIYLVEENHLACSSKTGSRSALF
jgi:hypothetical protein